MIKEMKYVFKKPFEYSTEGKNVFCENIVIKSPTHNYREEAAIIKGEFVKSTYGLYKDGKDEYTKKDEDEKEKQNPEAMKPQVSGMIGACGDIGRAYKAFDAILLSRNSQLKMALIDNKEPLTDLLLKQIELSEYEYIFGSYVVDFLGISPATT